MLARAGGRLQAAFSGIPPLPRAMLLMVFSTLCFSSQHALIRYASTRLGYHGFEITFFRNFFGLLTLAPVFWQHGLAVFHTRVPHLHLARGGLQVATMLMFFYAVTITPLALSSALSFTGPLFASVLAVLVLRERPHSRRVLALVAGFAGALIVLRPGVVSLSLGPALILGSTFLWSFAMLIIKVMTRTESPVTMTAYMSAILTPTTLLPALFVWRWPDAEAYLVFFGLGFVGTMGHLAFAQAFKLADTTAVLPLDFTRLLWASLFGYFIFAEMPQPWTWVGGMVIFAAATYLSIQEARAKRPDN